MARSELPYEMIRESLSWLPVKSLLSFKCVSKQWRHLITNPDQDFLKSHLNRSFLGNPGLLLVSRTSTDTHFYYAEDYTSPNNLIRFKIPFKPPNDYEYGVVNVCNGLVCFADLHQQFDSNAFVWNPFTGHHITIPSSPVPSHFIPERDEDEDEGRFRQIDIWYGFGFDQASNAYKVIRFVSALPHVIGGDCDSHVTVYTIGQDSSWRPLPNIPCNISPDNASTALLNGSLHWVGPMLSESDAWHSPSPKQILIALDMHAETFREIPLPIGITTSAHYQLTVGVLDGLLCIFCSLEHDDHIYFEIWVMKEYDVADSWRKLCKCVRPGVRGRFLGFLADADSQDVIISTYYQELYSYDLKTDSLTDLHAFDSYLAEAHFFKGSLLSPPKLLTEPACQPHD